MAGPRTPSIWQAMLPVCLLVGMLSSSVFLFGDDLVLSKTTPCIKQLIDVRLIQLEPQDHLRHRSEWTFLGERSKHWIFEKRR